MEVWELGHQTDFMVGMCPLYLVMGAGGSDTVGFQRGLDTGAVGSRL